MKVVLALLAIVAAGCSSTEPATSLQTDGVAVRFSASPTTVLVTNSTNVSLDVRAYPELHPPIPQPLGGMLYLGSVAAGATGCVEVPDTVLISLTNVTTGEHETLVWTSADAFSVLGIDTTNVTVHGVSASFTPARAAGWSVTLPNPGAAPAEAARCAP